MNTKNNRQYREAARDMEQAMLELMNTMPLKKLQYAGSAAELE